jgi:transcriptional regulator with XRE-family HTH domain
MKKPRSNPRSANFVDQHLAEKIRELRQNLNMSQDRLGKELGLSFQQVQKYEAGINRVSAARLYDICRVLNVPIASMFEGIPGTAVRSATKSVEGSRPRK